MATGLEHVKVVLLDIEGTVCSIAFVKDVLFPYALDTLLSVLDNKWDDDGFQQYKAAFPADAQVSSVALLAHVRDLTARDVKIPCLKDLQAHLWKTGYEGGAFVTPLYPDVVPQLRHWLASRVSIAVYSSGSIPAQKMIFGHTDDPDQSDVTDLISDWFDANNAGPKLESQSYRRICESLGRATSDVLFLSDNVNELNAAKQAELQVMLVDRPGNAPVSAADLRSYHVITSLDQASL